MEQNLQQKRQYNLKDVCIIYVLSILLYLVLSLVIGLLLQQNLPQGITDVSYFSTRVWYPLVSFSAFPISFILVVIFYSCFCKLSVANILIKDNKFSIIDLLLCILLTFGLIFGLSNLNGYFISLLNKWFNYVPKEITLPKYSVLSFITCFISVCVLPAVCEELLFRKLFVNALNGASTIFTIIFVGLLFSLFHFNLSQTLYQFVVGCIFVIVVKATKSTYTAIIMHFINNLTVLIMYFINPNIVIPIYLVVIFSVVAVLCVSYFIYKIVKNKQEKTLKVKDCLIVFLPFIFTLVIWVVTI